ncbi:hypothetical protein BpHYR1_026008 [Brachionus plicatilis]|uniref:Uncharacterized protein n=1 Tax=Brachionus plicatilis TaxID=10195 RepID=A0A3M7Q8Z2_BRAPC|nr:hypothetical protein BpHYR1_026008 [Brachionus plicatilis]
MTTNLWAFQKLTLMILNKPMYNLKLTCTFLFLNSSSTFPFPTGIGEEELKNKMRTNLLTKKNSDNYRTTACSISLTAQYILLMKPYELSNSFESCFMISSFITSVYTKLLKKIKIKFYKK